MVYGRRNTVYGGSDVSNVRHGSNSDQPTVNGTK